MIAKQSMKDKQDSETMFVQFFFLVRFYVSLLKPSTRDKLAKNVFEFKHVSQSQNVNLGDNPPYRIDTFSVVLSTTDRSFK